MIGMSSFEAVAVVVVFVGCWFIFSPVYQRHAVIKDFRDGVEELSFLKRKIYEVVSSSSNCPNEVGHSFPGSRLFSSYSLVEAPTGFSHGCLIRAQFGSSAHKLLRGRFVELVGLQTSDGLLTWTCSTTVGRVSHTTSDCVRVPIVVFP